ncbi:MAG: hypothetical protein O7G84_10875, partial [Gammaproteobacteria bacterium]|nr:hypothetical protein [Gammaproteobacteria bacterium]
FGSRARRAENEGPNGHHTVQLHRPLSGLESIWPGAAPATPGSWKIPSVRCSPARRHYVQYQSAIAALSMWMAMDRKAIDEPQAFDKPQTSDEPTAVDPPQNIDVSRLM